MLSMMFLGQHKVESISLSKVTCLCNGACANAIVYCLSSSTGMEDMSKPHFLLSFFIFINALSSSCAGDER